MHTLLNIISSSKLKILSVTLISIVYAVGIWGILTPAYRSITLSTTPIALLLSLFILIPFARHRFDTRAIITYILIIFTGYLAEVIGVNTGLIFGEYHYGGSLGYKLFDTPILIGINWLLLIYTSAAITERIPTHNIIQIITASAIMLIYDYIMEPVAHTMDMWYWPENNIPLQNYIAWFIISLILHSIMKLMQIKPKNSMAIYILTIHILFFLIVNKLNNT